jgi:O-antigen/teichoic acid export membrane protein
MKLLAALLTVYAMSGALLAVTMLTHRDPRMRWGVLAATSALFAISAGSSALALWRAERHAPVWLLGCGVLGAALCLLIPIAVVGVPPTREIWQAAITGAVLFLAFLTLASFYVRRRLRS